MERAEKVQESGLGLKKFILFAFIPAIIAAVGSVAPKLYEEITKPTATLSYQITSGPAIVVGGVSRRIYSIVIENSGTATITEIDGRATVAGAQFESIAYDRAQVRPTLVDDGSDYRISVSRLLRGERVVISALVSGGGAEANMQFRLRSNEIAGVTAQSLQDARRTNSSLVVALSAGAGTFVYALILMRIVKNARMRNRVLSLIDMLGVSIFKVMGGKNFDLRDQRIAEPDIFRAIVAYSSIFATEYVDMRSLDSYSIREFSDLISLHCASDKNKNRRNALISQNSLLLLPSLDAESEKIVQQNITMLGGINDNISIKALEKVSLIELREQIVIMFLEEVAS